MSPTKATPEKRSAHLLAAAVAAFATYFCMYAFRKPFTASTYDGLTVLGLDLKTALVISQLLGYMLSKFIGIKVVSELPARRRHGAIVLLILAAEAALVGFATAPLAWKPLMLFLNGLPLGMIFGLVLAYLEGRKQTEALSAALCASFIVSSGVVKSVGRWLTQDVGVGEFQMPMVAGLIFLPPLLVSVWVLQRTPPPDADDLVLRTERKTMSSSQRSRFLSAYWPGLAMMVLVYVALTVTRTIRDDFGVEIWRDMGVSESPSVFATSETVVAILVTALNAFAVWIRHNLLAIRATVVLMCGGFAAVGGAALLQGAGWASPFGFMVACGVGLYVPYVAFHTTIFERLIAASRHPGNLGFLMYVADAIGYLGLSVVLVARTRFQPSAEVLPFFRTSLLVVAAASIVGLLTATVYFHKVLASEAPAGSDAVADPPAAMS